MASGSVPLGTSSIKVVAGVYGAQAAVISIDLKRVYFPEKRIV